MITTQQIQQYREVGAVVVPGLLDEATRLHMKSVLADWVKRQLWCHAILGGQLLIIRNELLIVNSNYFLKN